MFVRHFDFRPHTLIQHGTISIGKNGQCKPEEKRLRFCSANMGAWNGRIGLSREIWHEPNIITNCRNRPATRFTRKTYGKDPRTTLRQAQVLERRTSDSATDIRIDDQFKYSNSRKLYLIFFHLTDRVRWTEIPLLSDNFFN
jgi:hypothetical protein